MVKLGTLMGAKYRLKQRRKRLTHRTGHEGAHDAFAREWLRRARKPRAARRAAAEAARLLQPEERVEFHGALDVPAFDGRVVEWGQCTCMHNKQCYSSAATACFCSHQVYSRADAAVCLYLAIEQLM